MCRGGTEQCATHCVRAAPATRGHTRGRRARAARARGQDAPTDPAERDPAAGQRRRPPAAAWADSPIHDTGPSGPACPPDPPVPAGDARGRAPIRRDFAFVLVFFRALKYNQNAWLYFIAHGHGPHGFHALSLSVSRREERSSLS